jgi:raffinose/stachyose/melibiose transport system substrate-binding protein
MFRARFLSLAGLTVALAAAGCGGAAQTTAAPAATEAASAAAPSEPAASTAAEPVTIKFWTWFPPLDDTKKLIAGFEAENPGIKVELTELESKAYQDKLPLALAGGDAPDIVAVQTSAMVNQIKDSLQPLEPLLGQYVGADWASQVNPKAIEQAKKLASDGQQYFLPLGSLGSAVGFYNKEIFDKYGLTVPTNYAEFKAVAEKLKADAPDILPMVFPADNWFQDELVLTVVGQQKPSFFNDVRYGNGRWDDPAYIQALQDYKKLYDDGILSKDNLDIDYGRSLELFYTGKAAMMVNGTWEGGVISQPFREAKGINLTDVGAMAFPVLRDGGTPSLRSFIEIGMAIPKAAAHPAEAMKFLEYLNLGNGVDIWGPMLIEVPSKLGYEMDPSVLTSDAAKSGYKTLSDLIANGPSDRNNVSSFSSVAGDGVLEVLGGADPAKVAAKLQAEWESGRYDK